ncbi:hypothetical protein [Streptomyces uncialis]|uniref:hypothetical protein n=1 Tax=Streptomyces uncialis TaxID=1048205 RepID=UPI003864F51E|nr:hypothetical protein OG268_12965 [Streptomyces uncialis]
MNEVEELLDDTVTLMPSGAELRARAARRRGRRLAGAGAAVAVAAGVIAWSVVPESGPGESRPASSPSVISTDGRPSTPYRVDDDVMLLEPDVLPDADRAQWKVRVGIWTSPEKITELSLDLRCRGADSGPGIDRGNHGYSSEHVGKGGATAMQRYAEFEDPAHARADFTRIQKALTACGLTKAGSGEAAGYKGRSASDGYTGVDAKGRKVNVMLEHSTNWIYLAETRPPTPK